MTDLNELADRVGALAGPDRRVDCAIYQANNPHMMQVKGSIGRFYDPAKTSAMSAEKYHISGGATGYAPAYTASIDAALTLVPEGWPLALVYGDEGAQVLLVDDRVNPVRLPDADATAATIPLAITAAALRARKALGSIHTLGEG